MIKKLIINYFIKKNIGFLILIILLAALFCSPAFVLGKTFFAFDNLSRYYPWKSLEKNVPVNNPLITDPVNLSVLAHKYFKDSIKNGEIPLWNKNILCGLPFYGYYTNLLSAVFYYMFSISTAHDLLLFIHLAAAGVFMFLFMNNILKCKIASFVSSVAWMFNGYNMVWFEWESFLMFAAILPATLLVIDKYFSKRSVVLWLMIIFCFGYTICINFAHIAIYQFLFIGVYILFNFICKMRENRFELDYFLKSPIECQAENLLSKARNKGRFVHNIKECQKIFTGLATASCLSLILGINFFLSSFEMLGYGQRGVLGFNELFVKTGQLPFKYLGTLLFPHLFGNPATQLTLTPAMYVTQVYNNYNELCIYAGAVALFLVFISFVRFRKELRWSFFFLVAVYSLLAAMGSSLYYPLAKFIPGLSQTTPTRIIYIFAFCMAAMAGIGMKAIILSRNKKIYISIISGIPLILAALLAVMVNTDSGLKYIISSRFISYNSELYNRAITYLSWNSCHIWEPMIYIFECFLFIQVALWCRGKAKRLALLFIVLVMSVELISHGWNYNSAYLIRDIMLAGNDLYLF